MATDSNGLNDNQILNDRSFITEDFDLRRSMSGSSAWWSIVTKTIPQATPSEPPYLHLPTTLRTSTVPLTPSMPADHPSDQILDPNFDEENPLPPRPSNPTALYFESLEDKEDEEDEYHQEHVEEHATTQTDNEVESRAERRDEADVEDNISVCSSTGAYSGKTADGKAFETAVPEIDAVINAVSHDVLMTQNYENAPGCNYTSNAYQKSPINSLKELPNRLLCVSPPLCSPSPSRSDKFPDPYYSTPIRNPSIQTRMSSPSSTRETISTVESALFSDHYEVASQTTFMPSPIDESPPDLFEANLNRCEPSEVDSARIVIERPVSPPSIFAPRTKRLGGSWSYRPRQGERQMKKPIPIAENLHLKKGAISRNYGPDVEALSNASPPSPNLDPLALSVNELDEAWQGYFAKNHGLRKDLQAHSLRLVEIRKQVQHLRKGNHHRIEPVEGDLETEEKGRGVEHDWRQDEREDSEWNSGEQWGPHLRTRNGDQRWNMRELIDWSNVPRSFRHPRYSAPFNLHPSQYSATSTSFSSCSPVHSIFSFGN